MVMQTLLFSESMNIVVVLMTIALMYPKYCGSWVAWLCVFMYFYRLPSRQVDVDPAYIGSPSDGTVLDIVRLEDGYTQIKIYLSVFDVHIQWAPVDGEIIGITYKPGQFNLAHVLEKSDFNEKMSTLFHTGHGDVQVDQIAGQVARRIVNWCVKNQSMTKGEVMGMIKLSSRVDIFVPTDRTTVLVNKSDKVCGGVSRIARWRAF
jgi:phosphatidylserine decarboxylase